LFIAFICVKINKSNKGGFMKKLQNIEIESIDTKDYPDFCDAFISYAEYEDGTPLSDWELDELSQDADFLYELIYFKLF